jgi:Predicted membrane protein
MLKTFTFAILHFSVAFLVVYALTGSFLIGGAVALIEPMINTIVFYFHEKVWRHFERNHGPTLTA